MIGSDGLGGAQRVAHARMAAEEEPHATLIFLRHGQSVWNEASLFTGWADVPLTTLGKNEAAQGATQMWREGITCFRAYDADLPEYAAAVDVYTEDGGEARTFLHVQEYAPPAMVPEHDAKRRFGELLTALREVFDVPRERIALKTRARGKGGSKYGRMDEREEPIIDRKSVV